jgi:hypothetical protein
MDNKDQHRLISSAADAKLVHLNDGVIFPLLNRKIEEQIADLCETFKGTSTIKASSVAYISACRDIMRELESIARHGDRAAETLGHNKLS